MHAYLVRLWTELRARWNLLRQQPEAGYSTETVVVTAVLVAAALVILGIIVAKVTAAANNIQT